MGMIDDDEVHRRFGYHPAMPNTVPAYELNRALAILVAQVWSRTLPPGREAALALTALEEALMRANQAVACNASDEWRLPDVDVHTQLDEVTERLEGPLHLRSRVVGGGGPLPGSSGGDIGPDGGEIGDLGPDSGVIVPAEGLAATHLTPEQVQGLVARTGARGPADDAARRGRVNEALEREIARQQRAVEPADIARTAPIDPGSGPIGSGGEPITLRCLASTEERDPEHRIAPCELVAGHGGPHSAARSWS